MSGGPPEVRNGLGVPPGVWNWSRTCSGFWDGWGSTLEDPRWVGRSSKRSWTGRGTHVEVWDGFREPYQSSETGQGTLPEVRDGSGYCWRSGMD